MRVSLVQTDMIDTLERNLKIHLTCGAVMVADRRRGDFIYLYLRHSKKYNDEPKEGNNGAKTTGIFYDCL